MRVIGTGFARTGTMSLKIALEQLGWGPCHHMEEVLMNPEQLGLWQRLANGEGGFAADEAFDGYNAQVDWPGAAVWRELHGTYPDALVIHTVRPPNGWWSSFDATIGWLGRDLDTLDLPPHMKSVFRMWYDLVVPSTFGGTISCKERAIAAFKQREEEVRDVVPEEQLLIFDVAEGWAPLCAFLGVEAPSRGFPHMNLRSEFWELVTLVNAPQSKAH
jgi:hypothetical protein